MAPRLPAPARRRQLLEIALGVFGTAGYHDSAMADIADRAGVTKPVLYRHYASKADLYLEVLRACATRLAGAVERAAATAPDPKAKVEAGFLAFLSFATENPACFQVLFSADDGQQPEQATEVRTTMARRLASIVTIDWVPDDQRALVAHGLVGLAEGTARAWMATDSAVPIGEVARTLADVTWVGLRGHLAEADAAEASPATTG